MSEYLESIQKIIKGSLPISKSCEGDYYIYNDKKESSLSVSAYSVKYKGYTVPLNESEIDDVHTMISLAYIAQEGKNKKDALKELKGDK